MKKLVDIIGIELDINEVNELFPKHHDEVGTIKIGLVHQGKWKNRRYVQSWTVVTMVNMPDWYRGDTTIALETYDEQPTFKQWATDGIKLGYALIPDTDIKVRFNDCRKCYDSTFSELIRF